MIRRSLEDVRRAIIACERCPRLRRHCLRVAREKKREFRDWEYWGRPVAGFGDPEARLLVIGLAPAAHGGNRTGRVFTGDSSGDWLYEALHRFGFASQPTSVSRDDGLALTACYVTAAARCAPPENKPTPRELDRCREYLETEIRLLRRVRVVVVLGRVAFEAFLKAAGAGAGGAVSAAAGTVSPAAGGATGSGPVSAAPPPRPVFAHAAEWPLVDGRTLLCSFHPSRRNTNTGLLTRPMWHDIFRRARALADATPTEARPQHAPPR